MSMTGALVWPLAEVEMLTSRLTAGVISSVMSPSSETCGVIERTVPTVTVRIVSFVVITGGVPLGMTGTTNMLRVAIVGTR